MTLHQPAQRALKDLIESIERLNEQKKEIAADIADKFAEAKSVGFDPKIMRAVIKLRKLSQDERAEAEALLDTYLMAVEGWDKTPMGEFMKEAAE